MSEKDLRDMIQECVGTRGLCRIGTQNENERHYCFPLKYSDELYLTTEESDFALDGYTVRRFSDLYDISKAGPKFAEIAAREGLIDRISVPSVDVENWKTVCDWLGRQSRNVIMEISGQRSCETRLLTGRIVNLSPSDIQVLCFNIDGTWERLPVTISFSSIVKISFGARYIDIFSRYLPPCPMTGQN